MCLFFIGDASMMLSRCLGQMVQWNVVNTFSIPKVIFYIVNDASSQIIFKDRIKSLSKVWRLNCMEKRLAIADYKPNCKSKRRKT